VNKKEELVQEEKKYKQLSVYVTSEDEEAIDQVKKKMDDRIAAGYRSSMGFEILRLVKIGLLHDDSS